MSDPRRLILHDLIRYLKQQQRHGLSFLLAEESGGRVVAKQEWPPPRPRDTASVGLGPVPQDRDPPLAASSAGARRAQKEAHQRRFEIECARFVEESLQLIGRTRAALAGHPEAPAQTEPDRSAAIQPSMFAAQSEPVAARPSSEIRPEAQVPFADRKTALEALAEEIGSCTRCGLHAGRTRSVPGTGNPHAGLVLIGEAPGHEEDRQGLPFVGRSGKLLTDILRAVGLTREDVFICNILKCRPPDNRDPHPDEAAACSTFLSRQLLVIQPKLILCLGRVAAQRLLGTTASLRALRHSLHFHEGIPVLATFHPAALLRQPAQKREAWDDIRKARALYDALSD